jgi:hypothetical protein
VCRALKDTWERAANYLFVSLSSHSFHSHHFYYPRPVPPPYLADSRRAGQATCAADDDATAHKKSAHNFIKTWAPRFFGTRWWPHASRQTADWLKNDLGSSVLAGE